jgi:hypothetical protein
MNTHKITSSSLGDSSFEHSQADILHEETPTDKEPVELESETPIKSPQSVFKKPKHRPPSASEEVAGPVIDFRKSRARPRKPENPDLSFSEASSPISRS